MTIGHDTHMPQTDTAAHPIAVEPSITFDEVSIDIAASPKAVYELVANISLMGKWSPETIRAEWRDGAHSPVVGAEFRGWNRRGVLRWFTDCEVVAADPGVAFAFVVKLTAVRWSFLITETSTGCTLTQRRSADEERTLPKVTGRLMGRNRPMQLRDGMIETLQRIKAAAEK